MNQTQINHQLSRLNDNLESVKESLYNTMGGDPGHDIGDASDIVELMMNLITEGHYQNEPDILINAFSEILGIDKSESQELFTCIELLEYKPGEYAFFRNWISNLD